MHSADELLRAITMIGSRKETAKLLNITPQRLNTWLNGNVSMGYQFAVVLQHLTCGQVMAKNLVPKDQTELLEKFNINFDTQITWLRRQQVPIASIKFPSCYQSANDLTTLAEDINVHGLLRPIVINTEYELIFGKRRLYACQLLNKAKISAHVLSIEMLSKDQALGILLRNYFTLSEIADIGIALEAKFGKRQGQRNDLSLRLNLDEVTGRTDEWVASLLQIGSKGTYRQLKKVNQMGIRSLIAAMDEEKISISAAAEIAGLSIGTQEEILSIQDARLMMQRLKQFKANKNFSEKSKVYLSKQENLVV